MAIDIPGLLGKFAQLPSVVTQGLLGPLPQTSLGLDPAQMENARQSALTDMAYGMLAGSTAPGWRNQMGTVAVARQNALGNYRDRLIDLLREQEIGRVKSEREQRKAEEDKYLSGLPAEVQPIARVAGPQSVAQAQIEALMSPEEQQKLTDDMREYEFAKSQGYPGSFRDWILEGKKAGATNVSVGGANPPKWDETLLAETAKEVPVLKGKAVTAKKTYETMDNLVRLGGQTKLTGALAPGVVGASDFLRSLGINIAPEDMKDARVLQAAINQSVLTWMAQTGGARGYTEKESAILVDSFAKLIDSPQARVAISSIYRDRAKADYEDAVTGLKTVEQQLNDIKSGGTGVPSMPPLNAAPIAPAERKTIGGKNYIKVGNDWYEE